MTIPLEKKLGLKPGMRVRLINEPDDYAKLLGPVIHETTVAPRLSGAFDFIHYFASNPQKLTKDFPRLRDRLKPDGTLWISWPKKASGIDSGLSDQIVRRIGLSHGLVDVKIASVSEVHSALKFVWRLKDRK